MKEVSQVDDLSKVTVVPLTEKWFSDAQVSLKDQEHLLKSLNNLRKGRDTTPVFKLYGKDNALELVKEFLDSIKWEAYDLPPGVKEYEYSRLEKVGHQGGYRPWDEMQDLFHLYQTRLRPCLVDLDVLNVLNNQYRSICCEMLSVDTALAKMIASNKIQDRAAGCRQFSKKKTDHDAQIQAVKDFKSGLAQMFFMYTFSRYYKNKIRLFMPGPFSSMLDQARFIVPFLTAIQEDIKSKGINSLLIQHADKIGFEKCFALMTEEVNAEYGNLSPDEWTLIYVQGDFEKMDTTTGSDQYISIFIPSVAQSFRFSENSQSYNELARSMLMTTTMPIASPEGMMVGEHGTGSGMENTNIGEGVCNDYYQLRTIDILSQKFRADKLCCNYKFKTVSRRVNGDDSAYVFMINTTDPKVIARFKDLIQESAEEAANECGFIINDKWRIDTNFGLYCQNIFWYDKKLHKIIWMYPAALILNAIIDPEHQYSKSDWDKDYRDIDVIEKLDNGRNLPYYVELVKFVDNGMKFHLFEHNEVALKRILSKYERYKALQPMHERYNRQDYDISKSPTINLILQGPKL